MNKWKSNCKWNEEPEKGTIFELKDNSLRIDIHHIIGLDETWFLSCRGLGINQHNLDTKNFNEAVKKSKLYIKETVQRIERDFYSFYSDEENEIVRY